MTDELWLEDIHVGHRFRTDVYDLTVDDIIEFATKWDPQPYHLSDETPLAAGKRRRLNVGSLIYLSESVVA